MNRSVTYQYDPVGNRSQVTENGSPVTYSANNLNQYTAVGTDTPTYDANGNLTGQNGWTYSYDAQNRLVSAGNGLTNAVFYYDARNRCVVRTINGVTTYLTYDGWSLIEERGSSGTLLDKYVHGAVVDEILARYNGNPIYYHHDGLRSTIALTDSTGSIVESYTYDVYGAATIWDASGIQLPTSSYQNRFLFTGRESLAELGLYDYRNRFYSPTLGRFLQTDPIRFSALDVNLCRYVLNSPVVSRDPSGKDNYGGQGENYVGQATLPGYYNPGEVTVSPGTYRAQGALNAISGVSLGAAGLLSALEGGWVALPPAGLLLASGVAQMITGEPGLSLWDVFGDPRYELFYHFLTLDHSNNNGGHSSGSSGANSSRGASSNASGNLPPPPPGTTYCPPPAPPGSVCTSNACYAPGYPGPFN